MSLYDMQNWVQNAFPRGKWENAQKTNWLISSPLREDKHPSLSIDIVKRCTLDRGTGEAMKLSEFCRKLGIDEPYHEKGSSYQQTPTPPTINKNALIAGSRWNKAQQADDNFPYLLRKGVPSYRLRTDTDNTMGQVLLIPAYDANGQVVGIERISQGGEKQHLGEKKNTFYLIGKPRPGEQVFIAEGYATACSIHQLTNKPVAVSFSAFNLGNVANILEKKGFKPTVCPDSGASPIPGFRNILMPDGTPDKQDWNDLLLKHGLDEARRMFREQEALSTEPIPPASSKETLLFEAIETPSPQSASIPEKVWHFPRKHLNLLAADSGMGKSLLITKIAADLSLGVPVLEGRYEPRRKTLYLNGEVGKDYFNWRFKASGWSFSEDYFKVVHQETLSEKGINLDFDTPQGRNFMEQLINKEKPDLLIIDSCPAFSSSDQNDGQKQNEIARYLRGLAVQHNMALVLITHLRKRRLQDEEAEPSLSEIQGSNAPVKIANVVLVLFERNIEHDGEFKKIKVCKSVKSWGVPVRAFGYEMPDYGENRLVMIPCEIPTKGRTKNSWEIASEALRDDEFTRQDLEGLLSISQKTAKSLLTEWQQQGKITRNGNGKSTVYKVSKGHTDPTPSIITPNGENPSNSAERIGVPSFTPNQSPPKGRESGYFGLPRINTVIPIDYKDTVYYIDGGVPNRGTEKKTEVEAISDKEKAYNWIADKPELQKKLMDEAAKEEADPIMPVSKESLYSMKVITEHKKALQEYSEAQAQKWLDNEAPPEAKKLYREKFDRMHATIKDEDLCREKALLRTWEHFHRGEVA
jgi:putative DNA primase/helicase